VEVFGIRPEARAGIVRDDQVELCLDRRAQAFGGGRGDGRRHCRRRRLDAERAQEWEAAVAVGGSGPSERLQEGGEGGLVAARRLDLDLAKARDGARSMPHLHGAQHHLGDGSPGRVDEEAGLARPDGGDGSERGSPRRRGDEVHEPCRRDVAGVASAAFTLRAAGAAARPFDVRLTTRQRELPAALAALGAPAEGDAGVGEPVIGRVDVGVGEGARRESFPRQIGETEPRPAVEPHD
jgi:hypothetical protein